MDRQFPLALEVLGNVSLGADQADEDRTISRLIQDGLTADQNRSSWLERQKALTKLRYGIRKPKTFPWPGASNLSVPIIDSQIRRFKPNLFRLVVEPDPIVEFVGEDKDAVENERMAEREFNWLFKQHMEALEPMCYVIDSICHRGFGIVQVGWDYQTEYECRVINVRALFSTPGQPQPQLTPELVAQKLVDEYELSTEDPRVVNALKTAVRLIMEGRPFVKLAFKRVITDRPALWDRDPVQVLVPPRTTDYGNSPWVIVQHLFDLRKIEQMEADGFFSRGTVSKITSDLARKGQNVRGEGSDTNYASGMAADRALQDEKERIWGNEDDGNICLWEVYHWHDLDGDGLSDRTVTWLHPRSSTKCCSRPYPYPFHRWPFEKFDFEKTSRRFHSPRGISAMLCDMQREASAQHNARLDGMALRNAGVYQMPVMSGFKARNFRAVPGTVIQTPMGSRLDPVVQDRGIFPEQVNEENLLRGAAENYVGNFDNAVMSPGSSSRRTATEVNATVQLSASTVSLDAIIFQLSMKKVFEMIWELWLEFRPPEVSYKVQGEDPMKPNESTLITVKRADIARKYKLVPTGTIANTNRALELQSAKEALAYFANDQTGLVNPYELRRWYFTLLDFRRARKIVNNPDQARELQILQQAAAELQRDPNLAAKLGGQVQREQQEVTQTEVETAPL